MTEFRVYLNFCSKVCFFYGLPRKAFTLLAMTAEFVILSVSEKSIEFKIRL